jgi:hypothetical protein
MKVTEDNNYGQFLKSRLSHFCSQRGNYIYVGLVALAFGLYWRSEGLTTTLKIFVVLVNGFTVTCLLTEILTTLLYKEIKRNRIITYLLTIGTLTSINLIYLDNKALYWSFATGLIFMVPVIVALIVTKISFWRR